MEFNRPIWVEVDTTKIRNNLKHIKEIVGNRKIIGVVKADAYGHGAKEITKILEEEGIYAVAVASLEEALNLRESKIKISILTLGYIYPRTLGIAAKNNISVTMFNKNFIKRLTEYKGNEKLNIYIDVDTGMGRLNLTPTEVLQSVEEIRKLNNINIEGIYTHFATADSDLSYAKMSFKARIVFSRSVPKGKGISYGKTFVTEKDSPLATIPVGYADGLSRNLSNKGEVLVKGRRSKIVGNVTMDLTVIDVTDFPYIHPGNEVVIIGKQGEEEITASEIAKKAGTINYEIVTRIGKRVKRIYKT